MAEHNQVLDYYRQVASVTDPGKHKRRLMDLPDDIPTLCRVVQGLLIHDLWVTQ